MGLAFSRSDFPKSDTVALSVVQNGANGFSQFTPHVQVASGSLQAVLSALMAIV